MIDLLEFLFSSLALGNQNEYLSVIYEEFIHNPTKFQFNQNHQISIGPFYKYFADYRMLTILETQKINFKPLSIEDMVEILKYPPKSIPNYLQNELLMFDYGIVNSVLVTINDMKVLERLIEVLESDWLNYPSGVVMISSLPPVNWLPSNYFINTSHLYLMLVNDWNKQITKN